MIELNGQWINFPLKLSLPTDIHFCNLAVNPKGEIWFNLLKQFKRVENGIFTSSSLMYGFLQLSGNHWRLFSFEQLNLPKEEHSFEEFSCDSLGRVWFFLPPNTICYFDGKDCYSFSGGKRGLPSDISLISTLTTNPFAHDKKNITWVAMGPLGLYFFDNGNWQHFNIPGFSSKQSWVRKLAVDSYGDLWIALQDDELTYLIQYKDKKLRLHSQISLGYEYGIETMVVDAPGRVWLGWQGEQKGLWVSEQNQNWHVHSTSNSALRDDEIMAIAIDGKQRVWVGNGEGLTVFTGSESMCYQAMTAQGLQRAPLLKELRTPEGIDNSLQRLRQIKEAGNSGDSQSFVFDASELGSDQFGRIWIKTHNGIVMFSPI